MDHWLRTQWQTAGMACPVRQEQSLSLMTSHEQGWHLDKEHLFNAAISQPHATRRFLGEEVVEGAALASCRRRLSEGSRPGSEHSDEQ